jgi:hypothetical protein
MSLGSVMAVGAAIIVFGVVIPPQLGLSMDFAVGIMLVLLGVLTLTGMGRAVGAVHVHTGVPGGLALDRHEPRMRMAQERGARFAEMAPKEISLNRTYL